MLFHLTEEQTMMQDALGRALREILSPEERNRTLESGESFHQPTWDLLVDLDLFGLLVPETHGGAGLSFVDAALVVEILGYEAAPVPFVGHLLVSWALADSLGRNNNEVLAPLLSSLINGEKVGAIIFSKPMFQHNDSLEIESDRVEFSIKIAPDVVHADVFLVVGNDRCILIENTDDIDIKPLESADLTRSVAAVQARGVQGIDVDICPNLLFDVCSVLYAADAFGGSRRCLAMSSEYAKMRKQFGQFICQFQAVKHQLADMAVAVEPARFLVWYAAHVIDTQAEDSSRVVSLAKAHVSEVFSKVARQAVQLHGGIGYTWEFPLHIWLRRSLYDHNVLGSPIEHRERAALLAGW